MGHISWTKVGHISWIEVRHIIWTEMGHISWQQRHKLVGQQCDTSTAVRHISWSTTVRKALLVWLWAQQKGLRRARSTYLLIKANCRHYAVSPRDLMDRTGKAAHTAVRYCTGPAHTAHVLNILCSSTPMRY